MKNKLKKLSKYIFALILITSFGYFVYAGGGSSGNTSGGQALHGKVATDSPTTWHDTSGSVNYKGVRLTFADKSGKQLGNGIDYLSDSVKKDINFKYTKNKCSKMSYLTNLCSSPESNLNYFGTIAGNSTLSHLNNIFRSHGASKINFNAILTNGHAFQKDIFSYIEGMPKSKVKGLFNDLLKEAGLDDLDDYLMPNSEDVYDLFAVFEPLVFARFGDNKNSGTEYFGTEYEMINISMNKPGGLLKHIDGSYSRCTSALCDIQTAVTKYGTCILHLDSNLADDIKSFGGNAYAELKNYFNPNSYFGGKITITSAIPGVCQAGNGVNFYKKGQSSLAAGNLGVGMGIIWPTSVLKGTGGYDCDVIKNKLTAQGINNVTDAWLRNNGFSKWTAKQYRNECLFNPPPGKEYNCSPEYNPGNCSSYNQIYYSDIGNRDDEKKYWDNCVFNDNGHYKMRNHKVSDKNATLTYFEPNLGSEYCPVYCIEELRADLPYADFDVLAGTHFVWGSGSISGSRTCKTKEINWNKFLTELNSAKGTLETTKSDYENAIVANEQINEQNKDIERNNNAINEANNAKRNTPLSQCLRPKPLEANRYGFSKLFYNCREIEYADTKPCTSNRNKRCLKSGSGDERVTRDNFAKCKISQPNGPGYMIDGVCHATIEETLQQTSSLIPLNDITPKKNAYINAINDYNVVKTKWSKCQLTNMSNAINNVYNLNPKFNMNYVSYKNKYDYNGSLNVYELNSPINSINSQPAKDARGTNKKISGYNCTISGDNISCDPTVLKYEVYNKIELKRSIEKGFNLPDDVYRYVLKDNNNSYLRIDDIPVSNFTKNYIDIGYSNFPVPYNTPNGIYNIEINYSNLGHAIDNQKTAVDTILFEAENVGNWSCPYEVKSKLIPPPPDIKFGGIDLVYREIDLINPFPNIDANGRNTGSNWCDDTNCSNNNWVVNTYIHNNRGTQNYDVYKKEPMYTFILTPKVIREVRRYNHENEYGKYTGTMPNKKYDYKCNTGTGRTCVSDYFTHIIDITNAKSLPGTCVQDNVRVYNNPTTFENCRYN